MDDSRRFAMSHLTSPMARRIDAAREHMEAAKQEMQNYCNVLSEELVMLRTQGLRQRNEWYRNFVDGCYGNGRRGLQVEPEYAGGMYDGELVRLNRGTQILRKGLDLLSDDYWPVEDERRRLALEHDLNRSMHNPLWMNGEPAPAPHTPPASSTQVPTSADVRNFVAGRILEESMEGDQEDHGEDDLTHLSPAADLSFRRLEDFVRRDNDDTSMPRLDDSFHRGFIRPDRNSPPPILDWNLLDDSLDGSADGTNENGSVGGTSDGSLGMDFGEVEQDSVSGSVDVEDNVGYIRPNRNSPPPVLDWNILDEDEDSVDGAIGVVDDGDDLVVGRVDDDQDGDDNDADNVVPVVPAVPVVAPLAQIIAAVPIASVVQVRRKRRWDVGVAAKDEPERKKVMVEGEESDFGSRASLLEEAEMLHKMLLGYDLGLLHLEVDSKLARVRSSLKRWEGRQMPDRLFEVIL